jgi:regulator of protease activity HflC (stomatin/prohibitin superfamily)
MEELTTPTSLVSQVIPYILWGGGGLILFILLLSGINLIKQYEVGLVERWGRFTRKAGPGFNWVIPIVYKIRRVNMTERMSDVPAQTVITKDKLNAEVDAVVYYQIEDPKASQYNVDNHRRQLTSLARTTLRAVIGKMTLEDANENRDAINTKVEEILQQETQSYGVKVLRVEIQEIQPPQDVQNEMNEVVKAEQQKIAAVNFANAVETKADGARRAAIKEAEGVKQAAILAAEGDKQAVELRAQGEAEAIKLVSNSITNHFDSRPQLYKQLEVTRDSLKDNSKVILAPEGVEPVLVLGEGNVVPIAKSNGQKKADISEA